jgi:hypothetical protein
MLEQKDDIYKEIESNIEKDPDIAYNQLIRPGKSALGLFYIDNRTLLLDIKLCILTVVAIVSRQKALHNIQNILISLNAEEYLIKLSARDEELKPMPPPGATKVVTSRDGNPFI